MANKHKKDIEIDLELFKQLTLKLITSVQDIAEVDRIKLTDDFYWEIDPKQKYQFDMKPTVFTVGQLYDDWEFLKKALDDESQISPAMLCHLSPLVRYLNYLINEKPNQEYSGTSNK
jgi:hypothetical protein